MFWEILKASKGLPVTDQYAALWGKKIAEAGGWKVTEITGELPLIFLFDGSVLVDYRIYGTSEGAGVETGNSFDKDDLSMRMFGYINAQTKVVTTSTSTSLSIIAPVLPNTDYTISKLSTSRFRVGEFSSYPQMGDITTVVHGDRDDPSGIDRGTILSFTTSSSTTYILAFVRNYDDPVTVEEIINSIMVTKGSTAPVTYIPYGYQIPILNTSGVTENLYDIATQIVGEGLGYDGITPESTTSNRSDYISVNSNTAYTLWHNTTDSVSRMIQFLDSSKTFFANIPPTSDTNPMTFTTPKNCAYIRIAYPNTSTEVMLVKGSTAPSEYIPHRYTSNYDLFIGDSKLGEEEYLDYQEQKVYKRTENLWDWKNKTINQGTIFNTERYTLKPNTTYTMSSEAPLYNVGALIVMGIPGESSTTSTNGVYQDHPITRTTGADGKVYIGLRTNNSSYDLTQFKTCLTESSTPPETYIPYLQPTDPPVPLPAINTYKGENTLSSTETLGEVTIKGRIKEVDN